jgi:short-subunit dehydrogenase
VAEARTAVVTGASSGIGEATVRRLAADGWRVLAVARREERLRALGSDYVAADLNASDAPARVRAAVEDRLGGRLDLLVNNAGSAESAAFADGGYENVRRTMELNFDSVLRLTEALLPVLRASAPSSIVNVASIAGRVASPKQGAYAASKFALAGWTDSLYLEEKRHGVHAGLVLPGFVATEGFPQSQLTRRRATRWIVSKPEKVAQAILDAGPGGRAERIVPRPYAIVVLMRTLFPGLVRRGAARRA